MRQESIIKSIAEGFCRELIQDYASCYCRLYYSAKGDFEGMDIGTQTVLLDNLTFSLKKALEVINQAVKERIEDSNESFYILAELDPIENIKITIAFRN